MLTARGSLSLLLTLQLSALVSWRWGCVRVQRTAVQVPMESPVSLKCSESRRHNPRREEYREFSSSDVQLLFWVLKIPIATLLSCEHMWTWTTTLLARSFLVSM